MLTLIFIKITRTFYILQPRTTTTTHIQITCWNFRCSTLNLLCCSPLEGYKITSNTQANTFLRIKEQIYKCLYTYGTYVHMCMHICICIFITSQINLSVSQKQQQTGIYTATATGGD